MAARLIHVVRHAHAGDREAWLADDDLRPLSARGVVQAERLVTPLLSPTPAAVYSSPSLRCVATVLPLARRAGLSLVTLDELYEGHRANVMLDALMATGLSPLVACTHGDVLADLLRDLAARGIPLLQPRAEKASTWSLEVSDGQVIAARYGPPP